MRTTGHVPTGVTLGHVADFAPSVPKKRQHWMSVDCHGAWVRSADALVVPTTEDVSNNDARPGVYVNPSNGIPFHGAL